MKIKYKLFLIIFGLLALTTGMFAAAVPVGIRESMMVDAENKLLDAKKLALVIIEQNLGRGSTTVSGSVQGQGSISTQGTNSASTSPSTPNYSETALKETGAAIAAELANMLNLRVSLYNRSIMLADSTNMFDDLTPEVLSALEGETGYRESEKDIFFAFPIGNIGAVRLVYPLDMINDVTNNVRSLIALIGLSILAASLIIAGILTRSFTRPIIELNRKVKQMQSGNYELSNFETASNTESNNDQISNDQSTNKLDSNELTSSTIPVSKDEVGELTSSFAAMANEIKTKISQLEASIERERQLKELQKNFISSVTHEFKTPLTSIIGYADLFRQYKDDPALLENGTAVIKSESERLYRMVEKVLYLSRVEKFELPLNIEEFSIGDLIEKSMRGIEIEAKKKNITLHISNLCEGNMQGDFEMLYRMFVNLLENSIKYNNIDGSIFLSAELINDYVRITVRDTGMGIGEEHLDKIFQPFYREDRARSRKLGGDGLGLAIVKEIVEKHKGQITIQSEKNVKESGTEVTIRLPRWIYCKGV